MDEKEKPGASKKLRMVMLDKEIKSKDFADAYLSRPSRVDKKGERKSKSPNSVLNMLSRDNMTYATVKEMADILGCDIVLMDRETGKIY